MKLDDPQFQAFIESIHKMATEGYTTSVTLGQATKKLMDISLLTYCVLEEERKVPKETEPRVIGIGRNIKELDEFGYIKKKPK